MATSYPMDCRYCDRVVDSMDSMADTRADMRHHLAVKHPDLPDYVHDPAFANLLS